MHTLTIALNLENYLSRSLTCLIYITALKLQGIPFDFVNTISFRLERIEEKVERPNQILPRLLKI